MSVPSDSVGVAQTLQLTATGKDAAGVSVTGRPVTWSSSDSVIATVSATGLVTALDVGAATLTASIDGKIGSVRVKVGPLVVRGAAFTGDSRTVGSLTVTVTQRRQGVVQSVMMAADAAGAFAIPLPSAALRGDSVDIIVDNPVAANRHYRPAIIRVAPGTLGTPINVVLVPEVFAIDAGAYAGRTVPVSMDMAFRRGCVYTVPKDGNCSGFYRLFTAADSVTNLADRGSDQPPRNTVVIASRFPIPVASSTHYFATDLFPNDAPMLPADSTLFWSVLKRVEENYGGPLFRPALQGEIVLDNNHFRGGILVRLFGASTLVAGSASTTYVGSQIVGGLVQLNIKDVRRAPFDSLGNVLGATVIAHELIHNLGIGHSCGFPSVMTYCNTFSLSQPLSMEDVAYIRLGQLIRRRMTETGSSYGLIEAMRGERVVESQLPYTWP